MIQSFADQRTQELYAEGKAKRFPPDVSKRAVFGSSMVMLTMSKFVIIIEEWSRK
jgi:hypothetical protein